MSEESLIAVFIDFENLAIGARDAKIDFQVDLLLKRLLQKGRVVFKRAYCDWSRYATAVRPFHLAGIELVDIPQSKMSGKNSADIRMVVDALDLCYAKQHIDMFALLSGDSDFSPLVSKLKENDKRVIGCGVKNSTSNLLISNCDEFIFYDDLVQKAEKPKRARTRGAKNESETAMDQLLEIVGSLERDYDTLWGSMIKQAIRRVYPGFNEVQAGYQSFGELLEDAQKRGLLHLDFDERRGNYRVRLRG